MIDDISYITINHLRTLQTKNIRKKKDNLIINLSKFTSNKKILSNIILLLLKKKKFAKLFYHYQGISLLPPSKRVARFGFQRHVGVRHVDCRGRDIEPLRVNIIMSMLSIGNPYIIYQTNKQK